MTLERKTFSSFFEVGKLCGFQTVCTSETFFFFKPHRSKPVHFNCLVPFCETEKWNIWAISLQSSLLSQLQFHSKCAALLNLRKLLSLNNGFAKTASWCYYSSSAGSKYLWSGLWSKLETTACIQELFDLYIRGLLWNTLLVLMVFFKDYL